MASAKVMLIKYVNGWKILLSRTSASLCLDAKPSSRVTQTTRSSWLTLPNLQLSAQKKTKTLFLWQKEASYAQNTARRSQAAQAPRYRYGATWDHMHQFQPRQKTRLPHIQRIQRETPSRHQGSD